MAFRLKIVLLMSAAVAASLLCILSVVKSIFIDDKNSYILDYNLALVRSAASAADHQIEQAVYMMRLIHVQKRALSRDASRQIYREHAHALGARKLIEIRIKPFGGFGEAREIGGMRRGADGDESAAPSLHFLDQLGWDAMTLQKGGTLIGKSPDGDMIVGHAIENPDPATGGAVYIAFLEPRLDVQEGAGDFKILLVDDIGNPLYVHGRSRGLPKRGEISRLMKSILEHGINSGATEWRRGDKNYLVAFQQLRHQELAVIGMVSDEEAYAVVQSLFIRSFVLGMSILMVAVGLTVLLAQRRPRDCAKSPRWPRR
jgi:hypothetical protein